MQMRPGKYKNRVIARGVSHFVNDLSRMQSKNEKIKRETYENYNDDEFYRIYKPIEDNKTIEIKNKYVIKRLREIERKKGILTSNNLGCLSILIIIIFVVILLIFMC